MRETKLGPKGGRRSYVRHAEPPVRLAYNQLKARWQSVIVQCMRQVWAVVPIVPPVVVGFEFHEPDRHRDPDGVLSGAMKLVMDAAVDGGFLPSDGAEHVRGFCGAVFFYGGGGSFGNGGLAVDFHDADLVTHRVILPFRLPDLNELLAARELGVRRQLRQAVPR